MRDFDISGRRILLLGATGFIGSAIAARLAAEGASVVAVVRPGAPLRISATEHIRLDLRSAVDPAIWLPHLPRVDAVINCAGVLQDGARDSSHAVHDWAPAALVKACEAAGVQRFIHFSAMGADKEALSELSATKGRAERMLRESALNWIILRPSVVVGRPAYGGGALFRGLAALPWLPRLADAGAVSVVQLDDVVATVVRLLGREATSPIAIDLAGPEQLSFEDIVGRYRTWLGWPPARAISLPRPLVALAFRLGDIGGRLGWRPPIRSTARSEMRRGAVGDPAAWTAAVGIKPLSLGDALRREPASVQERWFAQLYLLKPVVIAIFALFWLLTGIVSLGPGYDIGVALMIEGRAGRLSGTVVVAGGLADIAIGLGIIWRPTTRFALWAALAITLGYLIAGTAFLPALWEEPLGPLMKVWPIIALNFIALAILEDR